MANLLATMRTSATTLDALQRSLAVSQNNVNNASTDGYVRQRITLESVAFSPEAGLLGGALSGRMQSSRDYFAEAAVRERVSVEQEAISTAGHLTEIESALDLNDNTGIAANLDKMYASFSAWTITPSSAAAKENVAAAVDDVARAFQRTAKMISSASQRTNDQLGATLREIGVVAEQIRAINQSRRENIAPDDAGVDAQLYSALEKLSGLVEFQALRQDDGTTTILVGGETPLVVGTNRYDLGLDYAHSDTDPLYPDATVPARIVDSGGNDVTGTIRGGRLHAHLKFVNDVVPEYLGTTQTQGSLNRFAQGVADRVNSILARGYPPPASPLKLFVYGSSSVQIAHTISVNPALATTVLNLEAADKTSTPPQSNGVALALAALAKPQNAADMLDGLSYVSWVGNLSAQAGRDLSEVRSEAEIQTQLATQARNVRSTLSGVSLDEEAVKLVEYQRAYQASARVVTVLDELTDIAVNLGRR